MVIDGLIKLQSKIEHDKQFGKKIERNLANVAG
jgi:hypothetical protein